MTAMTKMRDLHSEADAAAAAGATESQHPHSRPEFAAGAVAATAALGLAGCGGGGGSAPSPVQTPAPAPAPAPAPVPSFDLDAADVSAARLLLHAQLAASDADIAAVRSQGADAWLTAQLNAPLSPRAWDWLLGRGYGVVDQFRFYDNDIGVDFVLAQQLVTAPDNVRKRLALALSEYFVISALGLTDAWRTFMVAHYWDQLNQHAFGNFRQLLEAVTLNPAMGAYLNTKGNLKEDPVTGRVPDENYAREVMQLFTLGLVRLNLDGTPQLDVAGKPIPVYTQDDVSNLARVFTGYDYWDDGARFIAPDGFQRRANPEYARQPMPLTPSKHSTLAASFLGATIPANTPGQDALRIALDTLFNHPNVGPFFARQMIQRLVTSNPSPAYVARVASRFNNNGAGARGDLKAVWRAILLDDEATGAAGLTSPTFGKIREPMVRAFQWARTFKVTSATGSWKWNWETWNAQVWFGQRPLFSPSVFNFFRPGYVPPGTALSTSGATAPEFQIVNESTASQWANFAEQTVIRGMFVTWPDSPGFPNPYAGPYPGDGFDITADYAAELALAADPPALLRRLNLLLCAGQLSTATQQKIVAILTESGVVNATSTTEQRKNRVAAAITLVMCTPEYIVQK